MANIFFSSFVCMCILHVPMGVLNKEEEEENADVDLNLFDLRDVYLMMLKTRDFLLTMQLKHKRVIKIFLIMAIGVKIVRLAHITFTLSLSLSLMPCIRKF